MTEVQHPADWSRLILSDLVDNIRETARISSDKEYELWSIPSFADGRPEPIQGKDIGSGKLSVKPGDVLISKINPRINRVWLVKETQALASQIASPEWLVARLKTNTSMKPEFLQLYLSSPAFRDWISGAASSVTGSHSRAKANQILEQMIPVPSLDEQTEIVRIVEEQFSRLDAAAASIAAVRRKADQFRRSILHAAFSGALTNQDSSTSGLPVDWCKKTVGEVASVVAGRTPTKFEQRLEESPAANRVVPFYKVGDMNSSAQYLRQARVYFAEAEAKAFGLEILPAETIIFPKAGGAIATNKKRVLEVPGAIDLNCMGVTAKTEFHSKLLFWFFESFNLSLLADGSVLPQIGKKRVSAVEVCFPVSDVHQRDLLNKIESGVSKCDGVLQVASELERRMSSLKRSLLRSAFAGELTKEWREKNNG